MRLTVAISVALASVLAMWAAIPPAAQAFAGGPVRVISITGSLSVRRASVGMRALSLNETVQAGDELVTDAQSEAVVQAKDRGAAMGGATGNGAAALSPAVHPE